ncbi:4-hydroxythreonine-4-phosphate dehydrogenase PdxA [Pelagicoccus sp. NFK12]|uniref:4-hydroxythreonine-4-phosphate dehydrogenase PdxA n=1 Tax=Pelagicoccus enzymogenes TaxID=2773457 RepID=A0A927F9V0_9BACT|nr:4-hydroxythreonine-4-phosphate dehydrogenase PdxA [Pelagicoccus enzymogenes]MBD5780401.1 4-hydroxythreonine-4-phosphate dehydrogenase PdxA [Pelagicoccus enzymogenes]
MNTLDKPILAITMGDAAGTGAEIISKAFVEEKLAARCRPLVIGDLQVMQQALGFTDSPLKLRGVQSVSEAKFEEGTLDVLDLDNIDLTKLRLGAVDAMCGQAAYEYVKKATELNLSGEVDGIVTSALNKEAMNKAGHHYDGHTGLLAELCERPGATMMLAAEKLRVSHVSTHVPLVEAIRRVRPERILKVIELTDEAIRRLGVEKPHIAVAGLNPHAGENGLFGDEEITYITPAIEEANRRGFHVSGPYPGDTVFFRANQGEFDATVAMFHDQGHVAAKMLGIWKGVNVTLGLPIIRTSVEHGTNFDMAGTGKSDPRSLIEAVKLASQLAANPVTSSLS